MASIRVVSGDREAATVVANWLGPLLKGAESHPSAMDGAEAKLLSKRLPRGGIGSSSLDDVASGSKDDAQGQAAGLLEMRMQYDERRRAREGSDDEDDDDHGKRRRDLEDDDDDDPLHVGDSRFAKLGRKRPAQAASAALPAKPTIPPPPPPSPSGAAAGPQKRKKNKKARQKRAKEAARLAEAQARAEQLAKHRVSKPAQRNLL